MPMILPIIGTPVASALVALVPAQRLSHVLSHLSCPLTPHCTDPHGFLILDVLDHLTHAHIFSAIPIHFVIMAIVDTVIHM